MLDIVRVHRVASKLVFDMVWINDLYLLDPDSLWGCSRIAAWDAKRTGTRRSISSASRAP
jgi:hypothetical protein